MSTRCQIEIEGNDGILLYQHSDGYPYYMLGTLLPFLQEFKEGRGWDPQYLTAQLMGAMIARRNQEQAEFRRTNPDLFKDGRDTYKFLGYGLDRVQHSDLDYFYHIDSQFNVVVYKHSWSKQKDVKIATFKVGTPFQKAIEKVEAVEERMAGKRAA